MFAFPESVLISSTVTLCLCRTGYGSSAVRCSLGYLWGNGAGGTPGSATEFPLQERWLCRFCKWSSGVGYQHHPGEDVGLITWCSETFLGFSREDWACLNAWSPSVPSECCQCCRVQLSLFWLFLFYWFLLWYDGSSGSSWYGAVQVSYWMWPTLEKTECSKSARTNLLGSLCLSTINT